MDGHEKVDFLYSSPAPTRRQPTAGFISSVLNLLKAAIGSGVLALPYAMNVLGYIPFLFIIFPAAASALFSIYTILSACEYFNVHTYEKVTQQAFKKKLGWEYGGARVAGFILFAQVIGSCTSYSFILKSQLPELIKFLLLKSDICVDNNSWYLQGNTILAGILIFIVFPLTCKKKLDFLKYPSGCGVIAFLFTAAIIITFKFWTGCEDLISKGLSAEESTNNDCGYKPDENTLKDWFDFEETIAEMRNRSLSAQADDTCTAYPIQKFDIKKVGPVISSMFFAFNCHDALLSIYDNLKHGTKNKMMTVAYTAFTVIQTVYVSVAFFGYFTWKGTTVSDILLMYSATNSESFAIFFARLFVCFSVLFSIPLLTFASRLAFYRFALDEGQQADTDKKSFFGGRISGKNLKHHIYNVSFLAMIFILVSLMADNLGGIIWLAGLCSMHLYVILPSVVWIFTFYGLEGDKRPDHYSRNLTVCVILIIVGELFVLYEVVRPFVH